MNRCMRQSVIRPTQSVSISERMRRKRLHTCIWARGSTGAINAGVPLKVVEVRRRIRDGVGVSDKLLSARKRAHVWECIYATRYVLRGGVRDNGTCRCRCIVCNTSMDDWKTDDGLPNFARSDGASYCTKAPRNKIAKSA